MAMSPLIMGMSMMPDEQRELHIVTLEYTVPFEREGPNDYTPGEPMTYDEYQPVQIYINDILYPYYLPTVDIGDDPSTVKTTDVYTFDQYLNIELTLKDTDGRESKRTNPIILDFTNPAAPSITCPQ